MARPRGKSIGLGCPKCGGRSISEQTKHIGRGTPHEFIMRRRRCRECKHRFRSREVRVLELQSTKIV